MKKTSTWLLLIVLVAALLAFPRPSAAQPPNVTVYDIQYTTTPGGDGTYPSPYYGQIVTVDTAIVTALYPDYYSGAYFIQDPGGGAWSGIMVFDGTYSPDLGDEVTLTAEVDEYYGFTELKNVSSLAVLSSGHTPVVDQLGTDDIPYPDPDTSEPWESVLVDVRDVIVTDDDPGYGNWLVADDSLVDAMVGNEVDYGYTPQNDDQLALIRGTLWYTYSEYKIQPRDAGDVLQEFGLLLDKEAPINVAASSEMTYTLTLQNFTGMTLTTVVLTDAVPAANAVFARALDGGLESGGVITWSFPSLADQYSLTARFVVTAGISGTIVNDSYAAWASNWPTPTVGSEVFTFIGDYIPICQIQGDEFASPYQGYPVKTVGVVSGFFEGNLPSGGNFDGFYIQSPNCDGDDTTSDGVFVNHGTLNVSVNVGDLVTVTGVVQEFNEYGDPCPQCETHVQIDDPGDVETNNTAPLPVAVALDPPGDPDDAFVYFESLEGMLATLPMTGVVAGPTNYGTIMVVPGDEGVDHVMRGSPQEGMVFGARPDERYGSGAPNLIVGSIVDNVDGPLAYTYGNYAVADQAGYTVVYEAPVPSPVPTWPAPTTDEFSLATFNTYNFDQIGGAKMTKVVSTVVSLGGPTFLAVQEIDVSTVITEMLNGLASYGYLYDYAYSHPDIGGHGAAVLWRQDRVQDVVWSANYQACAPFGSASAETYDDYCPQEDEYPLFSRRPVVVTGTVPADGGPLQVVVIGNHLKSKNFSSTCGLPECADRRTAQAAFVAGLADQFIAQGMANVLVAGDLNDFLGSPPLEALQASGNLTNTFNLLLPAERYTYIYRGVSQVLDHILVSPNLMPYAAAMSPLHYNADFPYYPFAGDDSVVWRTSDHDLVALTMHVPDLTGSTKTVQPPGSVSVGQLLTYTVTLSNGNAANALVTITDTLPDALLLVSGFDGGGLTWSGVITGGEEVELALVAQAVPTLTTETIVSNAVTIDDGVHALFETYSPETTILVPALSIAKDVAPTMDVELGGAVTYTITLDNADDGEALGVAVTDVLPAEVDFGGWVQQSGATVTDDTVSWTGDLAGSSDVVIVFTATVGTDPTFYGRIVTNTASFTSDNAGSGADDAAFSTTGAPSLTIAKDVTPTMGVELGSVVTYTIVLDNAGDGTAWNVDMTDALPDVVDFGGWVQQSGATVIDDVVSWTGDLAGNNDVVIIFTATVGIDPSFYGQTVTNTAVFTSDNAGSGADDAVFTTTGAPGLTIAKDVTPTMSVELGSAVTYTIVLDNDGDGAALGVAVTDVLPAEVDFGGWVQQSGATVSDDTISWTGDLAASGGMTFVFTATVGTDPTFYGRIVTNTVRYTSANGDPGSDPATFQVKDLYFVYLPIVAKDR